MSTEIHVQHLTSPTELYHRYPREDRVQPCYVALDARNGRLWAQFDGEVSNAEPEEVVLGHVTRWTIEPFRSPVVNKFLDSIVELAQRVVDGYSTKWSGQNVLAVYSPDASEAMLEISALCENAGSENDIIQVMSAKDFFFSLGSMAAQAAELGITSDSTDEDLEKIEDEILNTDSSNVVDIIEGLSEHLDALRSHVSKKAA